MTAEPIPWLADEILAAIDEVDRMGLDANLAVLENPILNDVIRRAANGRHTREADEMGVAVDGRARMVSSDPDTEHAYHIHPLGERRYELFLTCDHCQHEFREPAGLSLLVPAGTVLVVLHLCVPCATWLDAEYQSLIWM